VKPVDLPKIGSYDLASLEKFHTDLIVAGFQPLDTNGTRWKGPIAEVLSKLTLNPTMEIHFIDGWPFRPPRLIVEDLNEWHVSPDGEICLWHLSDDSGDWITYSGFLNRISEWVERASEGFQQQDFALDAHRFFGQCNVGAIATINMSKLGASRKNGSIGKISASWSKYAKILSISFSQTKDIKGRWYYVGQVQIPPRTLEGVRNLLSRAQKNNFDRRYKNVHSQGQTRLFVVVWDREFGREVLVLLAEKVSDDVRTNAIEVAPIDDEFLQMRAGSDVSKLSEKKIIIFGIGAIGSNVSVRLAESGAGQLTLVDDDHLRPGNVVRHAANSWFIGFYKVEAVSNVIKARAPWTEIVSELSRPWHPDVIEQLITSKDMVLDTTGYASFTKLLSLICTERGVPLISASLFRSGAIARVRRQAFESDTTITDRDNDPRYKVIPAGDEPLVFEPGCSSPIINASPTAVAAIAATTALVIIDCLTERHEYPEEVIEVFSSIESPPFDQIGRLQ